MKVQHFIFNWSRVTDRVKNIHKSLTDAGFKVDVINSDDEVVDGWVNIGNAYWLCGQFYKCLELFDEENDYLNIMLGDVETDDYVFLFNRTLEVLSSSSNIGIYAPDYSNKEKCWWTIQNTSIQKFNETHDAICDDENTTTATMADFFYLSIHKDIVILFKDFIEKFTSAYPDFEFWIGGGYGIDLILSLICHIRRKLILRDNKISLGHGAESGHADEDIAKTTMNHYDQLIDGFYQYVGEDRDKVEEKLLIIMRRCPFYNLHETTLEKLWK